MTKYIRESLNKIPDNLCGRCGELAMHVKELDGWKCTKCGTMHFEQVCYGYVDVGKITTIEPFTFLQPMF